MTFRLIAFVIAALLSLLMIYQTGSRSGLTQDGLTPVLSSVIYPTVPVKTTDGRYHLVYELRLTNASEAGATIRGAELWDPARNRVIASMDSEEIAQNLRRLGSKTPSSTLESGQQGVLWLDVSFATLEEIPKVVQQQVNATVQRPWVGPSPQTFQVKMAEMPISSNAQSLVIGPPLQGARWLAVNACCGLSSHRQAILPINNQLSFPERFAIDWIKLNPEERVFSGEVDRVENYPTFGETAIAVQDATVIEVVEGYAEQIPGQSLRPQELGDFPGTRVVLDLGEGRFALYAHLRTGSVRVRTGDGVKRGDPLGQVGNTGNTTSPHLHFELTNGPGFGTQGLPFVIDSFRLQGQVLPESLEPALTGGAPVVIERSGAGPRENELPMNLDLVDFH